MHAQAYALLGEPFAELEDPRETLNQRHKFIDILVIAICTAIYGADDWEAVALFGQAKETWFRTFLALPNGIPSHDTFWRVFRQLDPEQFQPCFLRWMAAIQTVTEGEVVALDGKQLRGSPLPSVKQGSNRMQGRIPPVRRLKRVQAQASSLRAAATTASFLALPRPTNRS